MENLKIRSLAFKCDDEYNEKYGAVALEIDVWAAAATKEEALKELDDLIKTQIEFALVKNAPELLTHPADKKWFDLWEEQKPENYHRVSYYPLLKPKEDNFEVVA